MFKTESPLYDIASDILNADMQDAKTLSALDGAKKEENYLTPTEQYLDEDRMVLASLRKGFAFKLFRLIKTWLAGAAIFLVFVTVPNTFVAALLALSVFLGLCGTILYDKSYESKTGGLFGTGSTK